MARPKKQKKPQSGSPDHPASLLMITSTDKRPTHCCSAYKCLASTAVKSVSYMTNIKIDKPGIGIFVVRIIGADRAAAKKELQEFVGGRKFTRYVDRFDPNNQIIEIHEEMTSQK